MLIDNMQIERGTKKSWNMQACDTCLQPMGVPITVIRGTKEGPTLAVTAACHPMELNGVVASIRIAKEINPRDLAGDVVIVHVQNIFGFQFKHGHTSPIDGVNMGRSVPIPGDKGDSSGLVSHQSKSPSIQIAEKIFNEVVRQADYLIDLHGGELFESLVPNIEILPLGEPDVDAKTRFLAQAFGFDMVWEVPKGSIVEMPDYPGRGSAVGEAGRLGIPGVFCEVGSEGRIEEDLVDLTVQGVKNVMAHLGMIQAEKVPLDSEVLVGGNVLFAAAGGLHLTKVKAGDRVSKGQHLGDLIDLAGDVVERYVSPSDAVLLNLVTLGAVNPGDMLYVMGSIIEG